MPDAEKQIGISETVHSKIYRDIEILPPPAPPGPPPPPSPGTGLIGAGSSTGGWQAIKPQQRVSKIKLTPHQRRLNQLRKRWVPTLRQEYKMIPILVPPVQKEVQERVIERVVEKPIYIRVRTVQKELIAVYNIETLTPITQNDIETMQKGTKVTQEPLQRAQKVAQTDTVQAIKPGAITSEDAEEPKVEPVLSDKEPAFESLPKDKVIKRHTTNTKEQQKNGNKKEIGEEKIIRLLLHYYSACHPWMNYADVIICSRIFKGDTK